MAGAAGPAGGPAGGGDSDSGSEPLVSNLDSRAADVSLKGTAARFPARPGQPAPPGESSPAPAVQVLQPSPAAAAADSAIG